VNLESALRCNGDRIGLAWAPMVAALKSDVAKEALEVRRYSIPAPLHVTTFHASDFHSDEVSAAALE
ncbi:CACNA1F, partial [Symbiodinium sp. CCMP2456]